MMSSPLSSNSFMCNLAEKARATASALWEVLSWFIFAGDLLRPPAGFGQRAACISKEPCGEWGQNEGEDDSGEKVEKIEVEQIEIKHGGAEVDWLDFMDHCTEGLGCGERYEQMSALDEPLVEYPQFPPTFKAAGNSGSASTLDYSSQESLDGDNEADDWLDFMDHCTEGLGPREHCERMSALDEPLVEYPQFPPKFEAHGSNSSSASTSDGSSQGSPDSDDDVLLDHRFF